MTRGANTAVVNWPEGKLTRVLGDKEELSFFPLQFHWHAPSEHTVDGKYYDLELHIVHLFEDGSLGGVVGIFFDRAAGGSSENDFLSSFNFGDSYVDEPTQVYDVNLQNFLDGINQERFWCYKGSLTTPPCTEGVYWTVIEEVQSISEEQLAGFTMHYADNSDFAEGKGNHREVQPLNKRTLMFSEETGAAALAGSAIAAALTALYIF